MCRGAAACSAMTQIRCCEVGTLVSLDQATYGGRRYVPLGGGTVRGPKLNGTLVAGGAHPRALQHERPGLAAPEQADGHRGGPARSTGRVLLDLYRRTWTQHHCRGIPLRPVLALSVHLIFLFVWSDRSIINAVCPHPRSIPKVASLSWTRRSWRKSVGSTRPL